MRQYLKWLSWRRIYCKVIRQEGSPESIARGVALGLFVGFFMPMGGQLIVAIPLAFLFKANKVLSIMGTVVTNPYTSTFIYPAQCWLGALLMGSPLDFHIIKGDLSGLLANPSWGGLFDLGGQLLIPFFVGGLALALFFSIPSYYLALFAVRSHRRKKALKLLAHHKSHDGVPL